MNWYSLASPGLALLGPERAHNLALWALRHRLIPGAPALASPLLRQRLWGLEFPNPVGLAAGFDKDGEVPAPVLRQGFGFTEIGTVTPRPQPGNPKPRLFRLAEDRAVINRLGFNNAGLDAAVARLETVGARAGPIGVNIGANKDSTDQQADYVSGMRRVAAVADYVVVNISSPNTPGLRDLQFGDALRRLLEAVLAARAESDASPPVLVKLAPDLDDVALADIAGIVMSAGVDGAILTNTTVGLRDGLRSRLAHEQGGLSGAPLFALSTEILAKFFQLTGGALPLIGVGGIDSGETAYRKIRAGASLVQLYTGLVYRGPMLARRIANELAVLLRRDGIATVADAVGADVSR